MFYCPNCLKELKRAGSLMGEIWMCPQCKGRLSTIALLRDRGVPNATIAAMWQAARSSKRERTCRCPGCHKPMAELVMPDGLRKAHMCCRCEIVWIEVIKVPAQPASVAMRTSPYETPKEPVQSKVVVNEEYYLDRGYSYFDFEMWKVIPLILGMPIELDPIEDVRKPWMTWVTAAVIALATYYMYLSTDHACFKFGLIPVHFWRNYGLDFVTSFLMHGSVMHLAGNLSFLLTFGRRVEVELGWWRWLLLLALAAFAGDMAEMAFKVGSEVPSVGASAGISGLMAFYALTFPDARIGSVTMLGWVPANVMFFLWMVSQVFLLRKEFVGTTNVAVLAHLGGVLVGLYFWWSRKCDQEEARHQLLMVDRQNA